MVSVRRISAFLFLITISMAAPFLARSASADDADATLILCNEHLNFPGILLSVDGDGDARFLAPLSRLELPLSRGRHTLAIKAIRYPSWARYAGFVSERNVLYDHETEFEVKDATCVMKVGYEFRKTLQAWMVFAPGNSSAGEIREKFPPSDETLYEKWRLEPGYAFADVGYLPLSLLDETYSDMTMTPISLALGYRWMGDEKREGFEAGAALMAFDNDPELLAGFYAKTQLLGLMEIGGGMLYRIRDASAAMMEKYELQYCLGPWVPYFFQGIALPLHVSRKNIVSLNFRSYYLFDFEYIPQSISWYVSTIIALGLCLQDLKYSVGLRWEF